MSTLTLKLRYIVKFKRQIIGNIQFYSHELFICFALSCLTNGIYLMSTPYNCMLKGMRKIQSMQALKIVSSLL